MFLNNLCFRIIILIFYFDNNVNRIDCTLLSRAKNPIDIFFTDDSKDTEGDQLYELPGPMKRMTPMQDPLDIAEVPTKDPEHDIYAVPKDVLKRNELLRTFLPKASSIYHYETFRPSLDPEYLNLPSRASLEPELINHYKDEQINAESDNLYYYELLNPITITNIFNLYNLSHTSSTQPLKTIPRGDNINRHEYLKTIVMSENVEYYEPVGNVRNLIAENNHLSLRTLIIPNDTNRFQTWRTLSVLGDVNRYKTLRNSSTSVITYSYRPTKAVSSLKISRFENLNSFLLQKYLSHDEPLRTDLSPNNIYSNEVQLVSTPVKVYPYVALRSSIRDNSALPYSYKFEPLKTTPQFNYANIYEPIKFSAFYLDDTTWTTKQPIQNYAPSKRIYQYIPMTSTSFQTYVCRTEPSMISKDNYFKSPKFVSTNNYPHLTSKLKEMYSYVIPTKKIQSKKYTHLLVLELSKAPWVFVNTTKTEDNYWNEFLKNQPQRTSKARENLDHGKHSKMAPNLFRNETVKATDVDRNLFETARGPDDYWNEFLQDKPQITFDNKNTVPLRTSMREVIPLRRSKLYQKEPERSSKLTQKFYYTAYTQSSRLKEIFDHNHPTKSMILDLADYNQRIPFRNPYLKSYLYSDEPRRSFRLPTNTYQPNKKSRLTENINQIEFMKNYSTGSRTYQYVLQRTSRTKPSTTLTLKENSYLFPLRILRNMSQSTPHSSPPSPGLYQVEKYQSSMLTGFINTSEPTGVSKMVHRNRSQTFSLSTETLLHTKSHQGFKTLWQPTVTSWKTTIPSLSTSEPLGPTRATRQFYWNFNDADAAWPRVQLILATTKRSTVATKSKKTFAAYFPFYLRTKYDTRRLSQNRASLNKLKYSANRNNTKATKPLQDLKDKQKMMSFLARQEANDENEHVDEEIGEQEVLKNETVARCYSCGLNLIGIPFYPTCYHIFDMRGSMYAVQKRRYKVHCHNAEGKMKSKKRQAHNYSVLPPRTTYRGGCFKRYVEFGEVYTERGCRTIEPLKGQSFASYRLAVLERSLSDVDEGCIASPYASLTPFARGVSLYARYHVCVCKGRYCNTANISTSNVMLIVLNILLRI